MVDGLRDAEDTAYLAFMAAAPEPPEDTGSSEVTTTTAAATDDTTVAVDTGGVSQEQADDVASQITALTGSDAT